MIASDIKNEVTYGNSLPWKDIHACRIMIPLFNKQANVELAHQDY